MVKVHNLEGLVGSRLFRERDGLHFLWAMIHGIILPTARVWRKTEQQGVQVHTSGQDLGEQIYHTTDEKLMTVRIALDFKP